MTDAKLINYLTLANRCDLMMNTSAVTDNGWKLSIQGKSINDSLFLYRRLDAYLLDNNVPFKVATQMRYNLSDREQSKKAMTIYCPDSIEIKVLAEDIYCLIMDYKGWYDIKTPTSYENWAGGVFFRNDRNEYGVYIPAK